MKNGSRKSQIEHTMLGLTREMLRDLHGLCSNLFPSQGHELAKDTEYLERRFESEGIAFLTSSLPKLGKWLDAILDRGFTCRCDGFKPYDDAGYPRFLGVAWNVVRHAITEERNPAYACVITCLRTVLYASYKLDIGCSDEINSSVLDTFVATDESLVDPDFDYLKSAHELDQDILIEARHVFHMCLKGFNLDDICPKHGPGAVATGERDEQKWCFTHLYSSVHRSFPYYDYMYGIRSNGRALQLASTANLYRNMKRVPYPTAKVVLVPKDSRGPRIISCEPLELQFLQQGVSRKLTSYLEKSASCSGNVNFTDQSINGKLALSSSQSNDFATLDLSEASDRVSLALVKFLMPPHLERLLDLRSVDTVLPDGRVVCMKKFAPMGSALCFPIESLVFYSLCVSALVSSGVERSVALRLVYVYGDDIIVPSEYYWSVVGALTLCHLKVNTGKSFHDGFFRESCGVDAFRGFDVTPQRIRETPGLAPQSGAAHAAWCAYASGFIARSMHHSAVFCREVVERQLGFIPLTDRPVGFLSVVSPGNATPVRGYKRTRWNSELQRTESKCWVLRDKRRPTRLGGWSRLAKGLLDPDPFSPDEVVVKDATLISRKWCSTQGTLADWFLSP